MASGIALKTPEVSQAEIDAFHAEHFSSPAIELFTRDFLRPQPDQGESGRYDELYDEYYEEYDDEDDGLGYYPDGVKRTLTDEQIAIFRHSELEALRRVEEKKASKPVEERQAASNPSEAEYEAGELLEAGEELSEAGELPESELKDGGEEEEGEIESDTPKPNPSAPSKKKKKKNKKGKNKNNAATSDPSHPQKGERGWFKKTIKPDLRKRTWDVVEAGMDSLDYDGLEANGEAEAGSAAQRRKISYDD